MSRRIGLAVMFAALDCTFLLVLALLALALATRSGTVRLRQTFVAGLALAAAVLVRPILSAEAELFGNRRYADVFPRTASLSIV